MEALNVEILNPKAKVLLMNLADLKLINIKSKPLALQRLEKLRRNEANVPTLEEITQEVELVRQHLNLSSNLLYK
ncbi:hypothetical protein FACS189451_06010 [Bacteroidia bacterium]|nr:hypothetical protein FACS189446_3400 [Bacteroidia bacterium]GHT62215.1 hypothetical protein FACS189451_06010 [Bacteroidia bacterium]